ncbi:MAG: zinc-ribbon domain-containing protein [Pyrinomonadaceae bacterium]|nr:zinc-ribbon domain-containing protein [Pyrinomonadaceae bacterium]
MSTRYEEQTRTCADCEQEFAWTAGEQEFFHDKGFADPPKRCTDCRQGQRAQRGGNEQRGHSSTK